MVFVAVSHIHLCAARVGVYLAGEGLGSAVTSHQSLLLRSWRLRLCCSQWSESYASAAAAAAKAEGAHCVCGRPRSCSPEWCSSVAESRRTHRRSNRLRHRPPRRQRRCRRGNWIIDRPRLVAIAPAVLAAPRPPFRRAPLMCLQQRTEPDRHDHSSSGGLSCCWSPRCRLRVCWCGSS